MSEYERDQAGTDPMRKDEFNAKQSKTMRHVNRQVDEAAFFRIIARTDDIARS